MSSIFGICHIDTRPVDAADIGAMQHALNYWDADGTGSWIDGRVGLGHLMLYNTPESLFEKLPLYNIEYQLSITSDARLDNRDDLFSLLSINTSEEKLVPDSTIILLLYRKFGADCVKHLVGDFAFAIWDAVEQRLFCARDQMGVKPFFYCAGGSYFAFATEKKGLLCLPGFDKTIDKQFYYNQLLWPRIQGEDTTLYKNIRRLPPAHALTFYPVKDEVRLHKYWTLDADTELVLSRKEDYVEGLQHLFETAVRCRLRSNYAIGAELSGGLDSSAITGVASYFMKKENKNIVTFSNVLPDDKINEGGKLAESERAFAEAVIKFNEIADAVFVTKDIWDDPLAEIDFALRINDGLEMWNMLWLMAIKKAAMQKGVRTLLSGFPGDEMVTYRGQFYLLDHLDKKQFGNYFSAKSEREFNKLKPFLPSGVSFGFHKLRNLLNINSEQIKRTANYFDIPFSARYNKGDVVWQDSNFRERFKNYRHLQRYRLLKPQVPLRMEAETRFGLSFKIEQRFPMADIRLTQFYLSMPNALKYGSSLSRNLFRSAVKTYLPDVVFQRDNKLGNTAPFRTTKDSMNLRHEAIVKLIMNEKKVNVEDVRLPDNVNTQLGLLELLRWHQLTGGI
jgi:asparagine synthase (glutamine-hydrolysing)